MKISVVTPLYNSAPYIEELHRRTVAAIRAAGTDEHEIVFVNDGSPDDSLAVAMAIAAGDAGVVVIDLSRNFGQHRAIMTGLAHTTGDLVFVMDSDLEEEPEWITLFHQKMREAPCDVVYGVRTNMKGGRLYTLGRATFYRMLDILSGVHFPANIATARLMSRRYLDALLQFKEREIYLGGLWHVTGFTQLPVPIIKEDRSPTSYTPARILGLAVNAATGFSTRPLVAISVLGLVVAAVGIGFLAWVLVKKLAWGVDIPGWASVMAAVLLIGSLQLLVLGIIAIYIAKIFIEVKQRPLTIVREIHRNSGDAGMAARAPVPPTGVNVPAAGTVAKLAGAVE